MTRGVCQGSPSGPTLFVLVFDPIIRALCDLMPDPRDCVLCGLADDLILLLKQLATMIPLVIDFMYYSKKATGLDLNLDKCEIVTLFRNFEVELVLLLAETNPEYATIPIKDAAKNDGVFRREAPLGPNYIDYCGKVDNIFLQLMDIFYVLTPKPCLRCGSLPGSLRTTARAMVPFSSMCTSNCSQLLFPQA